MQPAQTQQSRSFCSPENCCGSSTTSGCHIALLSPPVQPACALRCGVFCPFFSSVCVAGTCSGHAHLLLTGLHAAGADFHVPCWNDPRQLTSSILAACKSSAIPMCHSDAPVTAPSHTPTHHLNGQRVSKCPAAGRQHGEPGRSTHHVQPVWHGRGGGSAPAQLGLVAVRDNAPELQQVELLQPHRQPRLHEKARLTLQDWHTQAEH